MPHDLLARGVPAFELFSRAGLAASNGEARRLIRGGGGRINDRPVKSETELVSLADLDPQGHIKLSAGRKRHAARYAPELSSLRPRDSWTDGGIPKLGWKSRRRKPGASALSGLTET